MRVACVRGIRRAGVHGLGASVQLSRRGWGASRLAVCTPVLGSGPRPSWSRLLCSRVGGVQGVRASFTPAGSWGAEDKLPGECRLQLPATLGASVSRTPPGTSPVIQVLNNTPKKTCKNKHSTTEFPPFLFIYFHFGTTPICAQGLLPADSGCLPYAMLGIKPGMPGIKPTRCVRVPVPCISIFS